MRQHIKCAIGIKEHENLSIKAILDKIQCHLRKKRNIALDRVAFARRRQEEAETFDSFFVSLKRLAIEADLCEQCMDQRLVTQIMAGVRDNELRQKLLTLDPFPDVQTAVDLCRTSEYSKNDSSSLENDKVSRLTSYRKLKNEKNKTENKPKAYDNKRCYFCDKDRHSRKDCPALNATCSKCQKIGHWGVACRSKTIKWVDQETEELSEEDKDSESGIVNAIYTAVNRRAETR